MYILNRDPDWCLFIDDSSAESCRRDLERNFSEFVNGTAITDVAICTFCRLSYIPSLVFDWFPIRWIQYKDYDYKTGEKVTEIPFQIARWETFYKCYTEFNIDPVQIFLDQMKKYNKRAWLSIRMNDCHHDVYNGTKMQQEDIAASQTVGDAYGYFSKCRNFSYGRYRTLLLAYVEEVFSKYDFFGLELDFMREPYCFDYKNNPECYKIMTEYMRELKSVVTRAEAKHGHKIQILIRVPRDVRTCLEYGFDMVTIAKEGLIDVVSPCARWANTDSGISYKEWKDALGENVVVIPGIEYLLPNFTCPTEEHIKGYYAAFRSQGAPAAYIYNIMWDCEEHYPIWNITYESALKGRRQFIVGEQDIAAYYPINAYKPLPMIFRQRTADISLQVGLIKPEDKVSVLIDFEGDELPTATMLGKRDVTGNVTEPYCLISPNDW